jgi:hypothetical protein
MCRHRVRAIVHSSDYCWRAHLDRVRGDRGKLCAAAQVNPHTHDKHYQFLRDVRPTRPRPETVPRNSLEMPERAANNCQWTDYCTRTFQAEPAGSSSHPPACHQRSNRKTNSPFRGHGRYLSKFAVGFSGWERPGRYRADVSTAMRSMRRAGAITVWPLFF